MGCNHQGLPDRHFANGVKNVPKRAKDTHTESPGQGAEPYPYKPVRVLPGQLPLVPDLGPPDTIEVPAEETPPEVKAPAEREPPAVQPDLFE